MHGKARPNRDLLSPWSNPVGGNGIQSWVLLHTFSWRRELSVATLPQAAFFDWHRNRTFQFAKRWSSNLQSHGFPNYFEAIVQISSLTSSTPECHPLSGQKQFCCAIFWHTGFGPVVFLHACKALWHSFIKHWRFGFLQVCTQLGKFLNWNLSTYTSRAGMLSLAAPPPSKTKLSLQRSTGRSWQRRRSAPGTEHVFSSATRTWHESHIDHYKKVMHTHTHVYIYIYIYM